MYKWTTTRTDSNELTESKKWEQKIKDHDRREAKRHYYELIVVAAISMSVLSMILYILV